MLETKARKRAESLFDRNQKQQRAIDGALKQEASRYEALVTNMRRLRALRLARKTQPISIGPQQKLTIARLSRGRRERI
jgi:hypothetical protein